jgi:sarcosine oxidase gamma subunit
MAVSFERRQGVSLAGFKGPGAIAWAVAQGLPMPPAANRFVRSAQGALLVARLGSAEFFVEECATDVQSATPGHVPRLRTALAARPAGVYPVLREDSAFRLAGASVHEVLAQVCNLDFAARDPASMGLVMTLMAGVAVIVIAEAAGGTAANGAAQIASNYSIWCDPTFASYLGETLESVVADGGGIIIGESA